MFLDSLSTFWMVVLLLGGALAGAILSSRLVVHSIDRSNDDYWAIMVFRVAIGAIMGCIMIFAWPLFIIPIVLTFFIAFAHSMGKALKKIFG